MLVEQQKYLGSTKSLFDLCLWLFIAYFEVVNLFTLLRVLIINGENGAIPKGSLCVLGLYLQIQTTIYSFHCTFWFNRWCQKKRFITEPQLTQKNLEEKWVKLLIINRISKIDIAFAKVGPFKNLSEHLLCLSSWNWSLGALPFACLGTCMQNAPVWLWNQFLPLCNQAFSHFTSYFMFPKRVHSFSHSGFLQEKQKKGNMDQRQTEGKVNRMFVFFDQKYEWHMGSV